MSLGGYTSEGGDPLWSRSSFTRVSPIFGQAVSYLKPALFCSFLATFMRASSKTAAVHTRNQSDLHFLSLFQKLEACNRDFRAYRVVEKNLQSDISSIDHLALREFVSGPVSLPGYVT